MKKENNPVSQEKFKTLIGGQALIEGIMMQGPDKRSIVVRGPEGLVTKVEPLQKAHRHCKMAAGSRCGELWLVHGLGREGAHVFGRVLPGRGGRRAAVQI